MSARPYLRLLGGARIDDATEHTPIRGRAAHRRRLALLAVLAATPGNRATRERLIALLWADHGPEVARNNLSQALHVIRRDLGDEMIGTVGDEVLLNPAGCGSDVLDFREAHARGDHARAVALYGGPFLDGWYVDGALEFEEWVESERRALEATYAASLESLATAAEAAADWRGAARHLATITRIRPASVAHVLRHARALAAEGDRGSAIGVLDAHVRRMEQEGLPVDKAIRVFDLRLREDATVPDGGVAVPEIPRRTTPPEPAPTSLNSQTTVATESATADGWHLPLPPARRWVAAVAVLAAALLGWALYPSPPSSSAVPFDPRRIAVLYFVHDGESDLGYLADGLTHRLIHELANVPELRVASRTAMRYFRDRELMPRLDSVAAALGASVLVEGEVQRLGDRIRVTINLVNGRTQQHIGGGHVIIRSASEPLFMLQDEVAAGLAMLLRRQLGFDFQGIVPRSGTTSAGAQELADRAEHARTIGWTLTERGGATDLAAARRSLLVADSLFREAATADRAWSEPILERGWVARELASLDSGRLGTAWLDTAIALADVVLRVASDTAQALELRGVARWQRAGRVTSGDEALALESRARRDLETAIAMDSGRVRAAAALAQLLRFRADTDGKRREALAMARLAVDRDPFLARAEGAIAQLMRASLSLNELDSASAWCSRGAALVPYDWKFLECPLVVARRALRSADPDAIWATVRRLEDVDPPARAVAAGRPYSPTYRRMIAAAVVAARGDADSARVVMARALRAIEGNPELLLASKYDEALVRLALGETGEALRALREYVAAHPQYRTHVLGERSFRQFGLDSARLAGELTAVKGEP